MMFELQWFHNKPAARNARATQRNLRRTQAQAEALAQSAACAAAAKYRVLDHTTGRVVAVFGSSGKRLTFPIATAIAYVALAQAIALVACLDAAKAGKL